jgi:hypothetical protein
MLRPPRIERESDLREIERMETSYLVAPCHPGASPPSVQRWTFTTGCHGRQRDMLNDRGTGSRELIWR